MAKIKESKKFGVGTKHTLTCGAEVTVLEYGGCFNVTIGDNEGNTKLVGSSELSSGYISWPWAESLCTKIGSNFKLNCGVQVEVTGKESGKVWVEDASGNRKLAEWSALEAGAVSWKEFGYASFHADSTPVRVGSEITLNCGVVVTVVEYIDCESVKIQDSFGNTKLVPSSGLRHGGIGWVNYDIEYMVNKDVHLGAMYESNQYGWMTVIQIISADEISVVFEDSGSIETTNKTCILKGNVADKGEHRQLSKFPIGSLWKSNKYGDFHIVRAPTYSDITIKWCNTGHVQTGCKSAGVMNGMINDESNPRKLLPYTRGRHYVYQVHYLGELVYVGKGKFDRYQHPRSGTSHCLELNRLYFLGEDVETSIYKDDLDDEEAIRIEEELLRKHKPRFNVKIPK